MSILITSQTEIPEADFYVTATDKFMPGWGLSNGKNNRVIVPCTSDEVDHVESKLLERNEMKRVHVCQKKPKLNNRQNTYSLFNRSCARAWYPENGGEA